MATSFVSSGNITLGGLHVYNNFTLQAGHRLYIGSSSPSWGGYYSLNDINKYHVILLCHGVCRIHGHVDGYARGPFGHDNYGRNAPGHSQNGVLGGAGGDYFHYNRSTRVASGRCPQSGADTNGESANYATALAYLKANKSSWPFPVYGAGGAGSTYNDTRNPVRGGGGIWIQAKEIIFTGSMNLNGSSGGSIQWTYWSNGNDCMAGGGGGGVAVMIAENIKSTGSITVAGGSGATGDDTYSDPGGSGIVLKLLVPPSGIFHGFVF